MKNLQAGLYDPYLDVLGGGEKHILQILKVLEEKGYQLYIFWDKNLTSDIEKRFNLRFKSVHFLKNIFKGGFNTFEKMRFLKKFNIFIYVTDGSYFLSTAKKNFVFAMVPDCKLYNLNLFNKIKLNNYRFISNSHFTKYWLQRFGLKSDFIYPGINKDLIDLDISKLQKEKIILSVGRFFPQLHSKNQAKMINLFNKIIRNNVLFKDFRLFLVGGLKDEDNNYINYLKSIASDNPRIVFKPNITYKELSDIYKKSFLYWHFTGYGIKQEENPALVEHLGIAPLEAMAAGCLTFCYQAGGIEEIIIDGKNGYLFKDTNELIEKMLAVLENANLIKKIQISAKKTIEDKFSSSALMKRVEMVILNT